MGPEIKGRPNKAWRNWNLTIFKEFFCRMQSRDNFHIKSDKLGLIKFFVSCTLYAKALEGII